MRGLCELAIACAAALVAGCGDGSATPDFGAPDLAPPSDLAPVRYVGAASGAGCDADSDCAPSTGAGGGAARCRTSSSFLIDGVNTLVPMPGGFCVAPCKWDPNTTHDTSAQCPWEDALCVPFGGGRAFCWSACESARDCRAGYVCAMEFGGVSLAACLPASMSDCDPPGDPAPQGRSCGAGQTCVSFSPDASLGHCATACDPVVQDCMPAQGVTMNCVLDSYSQNGTGFCQPATPAKEGAACAFNGGCGLGMFCYDGICRYVCRTGGAPGGPLMGMCPPGQTCSDFLNPDHDVLFHADKAGICQP